MSIYQPHTVCPQQEPLQNTTMDKEPQFSRSTQQIPYGGPSAFAMQVSETKANLEKTIAQQKQEIQKLQDRINTFEDEDTANKITINELTTQIKRHDAIIAATRKTLDAWTFDTAIAILNRETVNDLQNECLLHIIETLKEVIQNKNKEHQQKLEHLLKENAKRESELDSVKQLNYGLEDEKATLREENIMLEESNDEKEAQILNLSSTLENYSQELAKLKNEAELQSLIVSQLNTDNACLKKQLEDDAAKNEKKLAELMREKQENLEEVQKLKQRLTELEEEVKTQDVLKVNFNQMSAKQEEKIANLEAEIVKLQNPAVLSTIPIQEYVFDLPDDFQFGELSTNYNLPAPRLVEVDDDYNFNQPSSPMDTFENNHIESSSTQVIPPGESVADQDKMQPSTSNKDKEELTATLQENIAEIREKLKIVEQIQSQLAGSSEEVKKKQMQTDNPTCSVPSPSPSFVLPHPPPSSKKKRKAEWNIEKKFPGQTEEEVANNQLTFLSGNRMRDFSDVKERKRFRKCDVCDGVYTTKVYLMRHIRTVHLKEKPANAFCKQCNYQFSNISNYKFHMKHMHGKKAR